MYACSKKETPDERGTGYLTLNISQATSLNDDVEITDFILRISDSQSGLRNLTGYSFK